jgi:hypothetical protein
MESQAQIDTTNYEKPSAHIGLRLPPSIAEHWKLAAKSQGKTLSDWLRSQVHDLEIRMTETHKKRRCVRETIVSYQRVDPILIRELVRVGVNLNQMSRQINHAVFVGQTIEVASFLTGLAFIQSDLRETLNALHASPALSHKKSAVNEHC